MKIFINTKKYNTLNRKPSSQAQNTTHKANTQVIATRGWTLAKIGDSVAKTFATALGSAGWYSQSCLMKKIFSNSFIFTVRISSIGY